MTHFWFVLFSKRPVFFKLMLITSQPLIVIVVQMILNILIHKPIPHQFHYIRVPTTIIILFSLIIYGKNIYQRYVQCKLLHKITLICNTSRSVEASRK